jgi:TPR repeat protein
MPKRLIKVVYYILLTCIWFCAPAWSSISHLEQQAKLNNADAQYQLGLAYETGEGGKRDLSKATYWYQQASENNHAAATFNYAQALEFGRGVQANPAKALLLYTKLAVNGDVTALGKVAKLYHQGAPKIADEDQAVLWYSLAKDASDSYQGAYELALQAQYNAQQLRQIEALKQQEQANQQSSDSATSSIPLENSSAFSRWSHLVYLTIIATLVAKQLYRHRQAKMQEKELANTTSDRDTVEQLQGQLTKHQRYIKKLKQQLKIASGQQRPPQPAPQPTSTVRDAYLRFGFDPNQPLNAKQLKSRYKLLSRVYHPDAKGSEEEMKQLNLALRTLTAILQSKQ